MVHGLLYIQVWKGRYTMTRLLGFFAICLMAVFTIAMVFTICGYAVDSLQRSF